MLSRKYASNSNNNIKNVFNINIYIKGPQLEFRPGPLKSQDRGPAIDSSLLGLLYINLQLGFVGTCDFFDPKAARYFIHSAWHRYHVQ